jgi:hypothetical protein
MSIATNPTGTEAGDWPEDAAHENGNYQNICYECGNKFVGHKGRLTCKVCALARRAAPATKVSASGQTLYETWIASAGHTITPKRWADLSESTQVHWNKQALRGRAAQPVPAGEAIEAPDQFTARIMDKLDEYGMAVKDDNADWRSRARSEIFSAVYDRASLAPVSAPTGYKLVPLEPTPEMVKAAIKAAAEFRYNSAGMQGFTHADGYRAMVAAAPVSAQQGKIRELEIERNAARGAVAEYCARIERLEARIAAQQGAAVYEYQPRHENGMLLDWTPIPHAETDDEARDYCEAKGFEWRRAAKAPAAQDDLSDFPGYRHCGLFELIDSDAPAAQAVDAIQFLKNVVADVVPMLSHDWPKTAELLKHAVAQIEAAHAQQPAAGERERFDEAMQAKHGGPLTKEDLDACWSELPGYAWRRAVAAAPTAGAATTVQPQPSTRTVLRKLVDIGARRALTADEVMHYKAMIAGMEAARGLTATTSEDAPLYSTRQDAARYRWLRNPDPQPHRGLDVLDDDHNIIEGKALDAAIDAAMRATQQEGGNA